MTPQWASDWNPVGAPASARGDWPYPIEREPRDWSWCFRSFKGHIRALLDGGSTEMLFDDDLPRDDRAERDAEWRRI